MRSGSETPAVVVTSEPVLNTVEIRVITQGRGHRCFRGDRGRGTLVKRSEKSGQKNFAEKYKYGNIRKCYVCGSEYQQSLAWLRNVYVDICQEEHKEAESYTVVEGPGIMSMFITVY